MKTASQILAELRIEAAHAGEGKQNTRCPVCSHTRKKKAAKCLSVSIDHLGVRWYCHHCQHAGGQYYENGQDYNQPEKRKTLSLSDIHRQRRISA